MADRMLGIVLLAVVAAVYGANSASDTYLLAIVIPAGIGGALAEAFYTVLLPRFSAAAGTQPAPLEAVLMAAAIGFAGMALYAGAVFVVTPSEMPVWLVLAPIIPAMATAGACAAVLVSSRRYIAGAVRVPIATALALIIMAALLPFERSPLVLALSVTVGYVGALTTLLVFVQRQPAIRASHTRLARATVARASAAVFIATLVGGPLLVIVERALAAGLATGSISLITFARNLALLPLMISAALASGMFPLATMQRELVDLGSLRRLLLASVRLSLLVSLSTCALMAVCRRDIVRVTLERGAFTAEDASVVARLLLLFSGAVVGLAVAAVAARGLFVLGRYRLVGHLSAVSLVLYAGFAVALRSWLGQEGLAIAFVVSSAMFGATSVVFLGRSVGISLRRFVIDAVSRPLVLAFGFGCGSYLVLRLPPFEGSGVGTSIARILAAGGTGLLVSGGVSLAIGPNRGRLVARLARRTSSS